MNTIHIRWRRIALLTTAWVLLFSICGTFIAAAAWTRLPDDTIAHNIWIENIDASMSSASDAQQKVLESLPDLNNNTLELLSGEQRWSTPSASLGLHWEVEEAVDRALLLGRTGSTLQQYQERLGLAVVPVQFSVQQKYDTVLVQKFIESVASQIDDPGVRPAVVVENGRYEVVAGASDRSVDTRLLISTIVEHPEQNAFDVPTQTSITPLTQEEALIAEERLAKLWKKTIRLQISALEPEVTISAAQFFPWLELPSGFRPDQLLPALQEWNSQTLLEPLNAEFVLGEGKRLEKFQPHRNGRSLNQEELEGMLFAALLELENAGDTEKTLTVPFFETEPTITLGETNTLGIQEALGVGTSTYHGSIPNRIYNVDLTTQKIGAVLVAPGEEFSFAETVGDISRASGYKSAYVIRNGRTELGDGGGVCQVSTTIFRAVLDTGLPISRWKNHSYRVGYYEQGNKPGFDATIYAPSVDFRFTNDTGHHIVVAPFNDPETQFLRVEIWGTNDGREASVENYSLTNVRAAPAARYQDDPSLPAGTRKQVDWAAPGATASFDYVVKRNGETLFERNFRSVYRPWQAVFLVGTGS